MTEVCLKQIKRIKSFITLTIFVLILTLCTGLLVGCGSSGGGGGSKDKTPPVIPEEGSTWDEMNWDRGTWG